MKQNIHQKPTKTLYKSVHKEMGRLDTRKYSFKQRITFRQVLGAKSML